jgi:glycosyltransferase involved in cell wall biosynthesis
VVVPTYRESANVAVLFERMKAALQGLSWEMIVVDDDSPDGASEIAFALAASDRRLRRLRRAGTAVTDLMSGFFMIRRDVVSRLAPRLSPDGFRILVDVILSAGGSLKIAEAPYKFRKRLAGESVGCSVGALANIDVASWVYRSNRVWRVAGLSGAVLSVVWNYAVSTNLNWRPRRRASSVARTTAASG